MITYSRNTNAQIPHALPRHQLFCARFSQERFFVPLFVAMETLTVIYMWDRPNCTMTPKQAEAGSRRAAHHQTFQPYCSLTFSPDSSSMTKGSLHSSMPVVSLSAPPLHGKPSSGELSSPSQSGMVCRYIHTHTQILYTLTRRQFTCMYSIVIYIYIHIICNTP